MVRLWCCEVSKIFTGLSTMMNGLGTFIIINCSHRTLKMKIKTSPTSIASSTWSPWNPTVSTFLKCVTSFWFPAKVGSKMMKSSVILAEWMKVKGTLVGFRPDKSKPMRRSLQEWILTDLIYKQREISDNNISPLWQEWQVETDGRNILHQSSHCSAGSRTVNLKFNSLRKPEIAEW